MSEIIYGRKPVFEALKNQSPMEKLYLLESGEGGLKPIEALARESRVPFSRVPGDKLSQLAGTSHHQGVVAVLSAREYADLEEILALALKSPDPPFLLALEEVQDPHNLGSLIRTAEAAGVHGILIPKRHAVGLTGTVSKVAAGALEYMPVARVSNIGYTLKELKKQGFWIIGADEDAEKNYTKTDLTGPVALVLGGEDRGLSLPVRKECDLLVRIPMKGRINSLNVGVAGGVLIFEIMRQRKIKG